MTVAVLTPMANPTVEAEFRAFLPLDLPWVTGRLVSDEPDSPKRLVAYAETIGQSLRQFDALPLSAVAFACTGSSYLIGRDRQAALARTLPMAAPVLWATDAIEARLKSIAARRIAVVSPYPSELHTAALSYWRDGQWQVTFDARIEIGSNDTRAIYALQSHSAAEAIAAARDTGPDAILLSGTGMPTRALLDPAGAPPVISTNLCLADAIVAAVGDHA